MKVEEIPYEELEALLSLARMSEKQLKSYMQLISREMRKRKKAEDES